MEDQTSLLQGSMQEDSFEVVMRGYNKRQVDDYVLQCQHHIRDLAQRLALTEQEIGRVRSEATTAIEKAAAAKPVHEEVSERLGQILRLANEEAERERAAAADEIAVMHAQALADTKNLRDMASRETEALRQQAVAETQAQRDAAQLETQALRERVTAEVDSLRQRTERDAADELDRARTEAERVLSSAREAAERDVAEAHAAATEVEQTARVESERLMLAAQERSESLISEAERRADAINTVLGARLEALTTTHRDVVGRLADLRSTLVDALGREEALGAFEVPGPAGTPGPSGSSLRAPDLYTSGAGGSASGYDSPGSHVTVPGDAVHGGPQTSVRPSWQVPAGDEPSRGRSGGDPLTDDLDDDLDPEGPGTARTVTGTGAGSPGSRRLDLTSVPDRTHQ